jgi:hypothetical protein
MIGLILASALSENDLHPFVGNSRVGTKVGGHCAEQIPYPENGAFYSIGIGGAVSR